MSTAANTSCSPAKSKSFCQTYCCSRRFCYKKLFTKEDPIYLHKIFGLLSLVSFVYRYVYCALVYGNLHFENRWIDHATMALHMALSSSSIIFHVLTHRILHKPMIIWHEYRMHAIVFTLRCVLVYTFAVVRPFNNTTVERLALIPVVLVNHLLADEITRRYGPKDKSQTTVRVQAKSGSYYTKLILRFYSFYQFSALGSHLLPNARLADLGFNTLIAIQSSAFLMTLFRKGLIRYYTHALWYTGCLILSLYHMHAQIPGYVFWLKVATCFMMRIKLRMNKYLIWTLFVIASMPSVELLIHDHFAEASDIIKGVSEQWLMDTPQIESIVQWEMLKGLGVTGSRTVIGVCLLLSGTVGFFLQAQSNLSPKSTRLAASASE